MKEFNVISIIFGGICGLITFLFGAWNHTLTALLIFVIIDYITGIVKAFIEKELNSKVGFIGIWKKILIFAIIIIAYQIEVTLNYSIALKEIVTLFYLCNEALSILENTAKFLPIPDQLKEAIEQIRG